MSNKGHGIERPAKGWVYAIRDALGMTKTQLGQRMNVSQQRISELEAAETNDAVTLRSLRAAAHAMNCELVYAIVPKGQSLEELYLKQAKRVAKKRLAKIQHTMMLEQQTLTKDQLQVLENDLLDEVIHESPKNIWMD